MTDPDVPDTKSTRRGILFGHLSRFNENPGVKALVIVAELLPLVALVVGAGIWLVRQIDGDDSSASTIPGTTVVVPVTPGPSTVVPGGDGSTTTRPTTPTLSVTGPRCWTSTNTVVDCRESHRFEEIPAAATCDQRVVIEFLGGLASSDVTTARATKIPGGGCSVDAGRDVAGSTKGVLQGDGSAAWRRCFDRRTGKNLSCAVLHSGEYFATGSLRRATDAECVLAAAQYLDQNPGNLIEDLAVRRLDVKTGTPDSARCIIAARGNHLLTTSVHALGSRPVPIYSQ